MPSIEELDRLMKVKETNEFKYTDIKRKRINR